MRRVSAAARALDSSRDAMATMSQRSDLCMAGTTFSSPILAVLMIPHRTGFTASPRLDPARAAAAARSLASGGSHVAAGLAAGGRSPRGGIPSRTAWRGSR